MQKPVSSSASCVDIFPSMTNGFIMHISVYFAKNIVLSSAHRKWSHCDNTIHLLYWPGLEKCPDNLLIMTLSTANITRYAYSCSQTATGSTKITLTSRSVQHAVNKKWYLNGLVFLFSSVSQCRQQTTRLND